MAEVRDGSKTLAKLKERVEYWSTGLSRAKWDLDAYEERLSNGIVNYAKAPKYMVDPFRVHLERMDWDSLRAKAERQYEIDPNQYEEPGELIEAMVAAEFDL